MVKLSRRFSFWKIALVVITINIFMGLLAIIALSVMGSASEVTRIREIMKWQNIYKQAINISVTTVLAYYALNYYHALIIEKKPFIHYLPFSALFALLALSYYALLFHFFPDKGFTFGLIIFSYVLNTLFFISLCLVIAYFVSLRDEKEQRKVLEQQKMQLEVEKSQANFNFLKAQINPHFLHNTLNFLYSKSLRYSAELSEGILTLSEIMRYALSEENTKDGKVLLITEIEHVRNVIKINQLRFSNNLHVKFDVDGEVNSATIIPFVLITLVENAFKHGDLKSLDHPIEIKLKVDKKGLVFLCRNKKKNGPKEISTGIGLENIRKRLELAHGRNFRLNIKDENDYYSTELSIVNS